MRVKSLGFAEVKGTAILPRERIRVGPSGVAGDRRFAAVEAGGGAVLRTVRNPALLAVRARCDGSALELGFPDSSRVTQLLEVGRRWDADYWGRRLEVEELPGPASRALAGYLGQDCVLAGLVRPGGFVFGAPVSLWFASSLAELERRMGGPVDPRRFRLTVGVDDLTEPVDEETLVGSRLRIGEVDVLVEEWIGRCPVANLHPEHPGGEADVLAVLADYRTREGKVCWGVAGRALNEGVVTVGDGVALI